MSTTEDSDLSPILKQRKKIRDQSQALFNGELKTCEGGRCLSRTIKGAGCLRTVSVQRHTINLLNAVDIATDGTLQGGDLEEVIKDMAPNWCCDRHHHKDQVSGPLKTLLRVTLLHRERYPESMRYLQSQAHPHESTRIDGVVDHLEIHAEKNTTDVNTTDYQSAHTLVMEKGFHDLQTCLEAGFAKLCGTQAEPVMCDTKVDSDQDTTPIKISPESFVTLAQFTKFRERVVGMFSALGEVQDKHAKKFKTFYKWMNLKTV